MKVQRDDIGAATFCERVHFEDGLHLHVVGARPQIVRHLQPPVREERAIDLLEEPSKGSALEQCALPAEDLLEGGVLVDLRLLFGVGVCEDRNEDVRSDKDQEEDEEQEEDRGADRVSVFPVIVLEVKSADREPQQGEQREKLMRSCLLMTVKQQIWTL